MGNQGNVFPCLWLLSIISIQCCHHIYSMRPPSLFNAATIFICCYHLYSMSRPSSALHIHIRDGKTSTFTHYKMKVSPCISDVFYCSCSKRGTSPPPPHTQLTALPQDPHVYNIVDIMDIVDIKEIKDKHT